ncbi:MAG: carboxypeptidase-like regulatory domain-containing protein, partial [Planctomycetota bacterium]
MLGATALAAAGVLAALRLGSGWEGSGSANPAGPPGESVGVGVPLAPDSAAGDPRRQALPSPATVPSPRNLSDRILVRGRLAMSDGSPPPPDAEVRALTGRAAVDYPETIVLLGGKGAHERASREGDLRRRVRDLGGWKPGYTARARADGSFELAVPRDFPAFRFEVEADFAGYFRERRFSLASPEVLAGVTLVLDAAARVEGRLTDASGHPVRAGRVSLVEPLALSLRRIKPERGADAQSDAEGRFVFRGVAPGEWSLGAVAEGLGYGRRRVDAVARETARADLVLAEEGAIVGKVVDESEGGVAGARVQAVPGEWSPEAMRLEYGSG